jgi:class 3 adenylate cyclase/peptidoglycan hydrolase-like protein with peptidoglycan-binding domain
MSSPTAEDGRPGGLPAAVALSARRRRLSAILHADLAGYVRLMEGAEDRTVGHLKKVRVEVWQSAIEAAGGRIVNIVADSVLAEFSSAVAAIAAAFDIQERMARFNEGLDEEQRLMFRIGLHLGEVIVDETETIFGDAVNVAARIQLMAEPGGIAASRALRDAAHLQVDCAFVDGGRHHAKNVSRSLQVYHLRTRDSTSTPLVRAASRIQRPALFGTIAAATVLLAGGGYLAFMANPMTPASVAALTLSAEQLEQALAERRQADALAAEKRQLEEQARQWTETEAEAQRQADLELEAARQARQKAERELAQLKAAIEALRSAKNGDGDQAAVRAQRAAEEAAQRKAEAEAASLRQAEDEAAKKAAATMPRRDEAAESMERHLRLQPIDRRRLQVALTSLGFDTRGDDGVFGARSREMIARWQKARNWAPTGFVTGAQQQALLKEAAAALSTYDEQRIAEQDVRLTAGAPVAPPARAPADLADGLWRGTYQCGHNGALFTLRPELHLKGGTGTWHAANTSQANGNTMDVGVSVDGTDVRVTRRGLSQWAGDTTPLLGQLDGNSIRASNKNCTVLLTRDVSSAVAATAPATASVNTTYNAAYSDASPTLLARASYFSSAADASWVAVSSAENGTSPNCQFNERPFGQGDWQVDIKGNTLTFAGRATKRSFTLDLKALQPDGSGKVVGKDDKNREFYLTFDPGSGARPFLVTDSITPCRSVFTPKK